MPPNGLALARPTTLRVMLIPIPVPAVPPQTGYVIGNVYQVQVTDVDGHPIGLRPGTAITLYLLPPKAVPGTTIQRLDGGHWTVLDTSASPSCTNSIQASSDRFGVFAMVDPNPAPGSGAAGASPPWLAAVAALASALIVGAVLVLLTRGRRTATSRR